MTFDAEVLNGKRCPYCGKRSNYVDSEKIYGVSYGMIYICWPCDAYVGCHKGRKKAMGRLANAELRKWKRKAHFYFDRLWKKKIRQGSTKHEARTAAYAWLAREMKLPIKFTHIGMFDVEECKKVIEICKPFYVERR